MRSPVHPARAQLLRLLLGIRRAVNSPGQSIRRMRLTHAKKRNSSLIASFPGMGCTMLVDPTTYFGEIYVRGEYEPQLVRYLKRSIRQSMVCIDVGANVGYFSLLMARLVGPRGRVFAFEPTTKTREVLKASADLNGYSHLTVEGLAVTDRVGNLEFNVGPSGFDVYNSGGAVSHPHARPQAFSTQVVPCTTLDDYCHEWAVRNVDLVKIDVEGGELSVLKGMERLQGANPELRIVLEFADVTTNGFGYEARELGHWLQERGWRLSILGYTGARPVESADRQWNGELVLAERSKTA